MAKKKPEPNKKKKRDDGGVAGELANIRASRDEGVHGLIDEGLAQAFQSLNDQGVEALSAEESLGRTICLKMPALAPRFFFGIEGLVLGRMYLVAGPQESCKSALLSEIGRWHAMSGGFYSVVETEQKDASGLRDSFFNYNRKQWKQSRAFTQDEWNNVFFKQSNAFRTMMDGGSVKDKDNKTVKVKGTGRIAPIMWGVDSISAVTIAKFSEKTQEEGAPQQNHPLHAKMLSDFLKEAPKLLCDFPMTMFMVSHEKYSANPAAPHIQVRNTSGGAAPKYQVTTDISMRRLDKHQYKRTHPKYGEVYAIPLGMSIFKNSMGSHHKLEVEMCWYFDPDDVDPIHGQKRQKSYFDWETASIELIKLAQATGESGIGFYANHTKALRELIDLDVSDNMVTSDALDIKSAVPIREAGFILEEKLQSDQTFATDLYSLLEIRRQFMFKPGVDLRTQIKENTELIVAHDKNRNLAPSGVPPVAEVAEAPADETDEPADPDALVEPPPEV